MKVGRREKGGRERMNEKEKKKKKEKNHCLRADAQTLNFRNGTEEKFWENNKYSERKHKHSARHVQFSHNFAKVSLINTTVL